MYPQRLLITNPLRRAENYETVCHIVVDAKEVPCFILPSQMGFPCFVQPYEVVYIYGQTEFKAQLRWTEEVRDELSSMLHPF